MSTTATEIEAVDVLGATLKIRRFGAGPELVLLHGEDGFLFNRPFLEALGREFTVVAPEHPGWGSARPTHLRTIDDLAYLYLEFLDRQQKTVPVIGVSIGAWLAAEIATKSEAGISHLVLVSPVGIKNGTRDDRAFVDLYASSSDQVRRALYADVAKAPNAAEFSDDQFLELAVAQEAVARFAWEPYLHNPQLRHRLPRIRVPSLVVHGADDAFVLEPDYFSTFGSLIGDNARVVPVADAGHRVDEEQPTALAETIAAFVRGADVGRRLQPSGVSS